MPSGETYNPLCDTLTVSPTQHLTSLHASVFFLSTSACFIISHHTITHIWRRGNYGKTVDKESVWCVLLVWVCVTSKHSQQNEHLDFPLIPVVLVKVAFKLANVLHFLWLLCSESRHVICSAIRKYLLDVVYQELNMTPDTERRQKTVNSEAVIKVIKLHWIAVMRL